MIIDKCRGIACAAALFALLITYRDAEAQIPINPATAGDEAFPLIDEIDSFLARSKCIASWELQEFHDRVQKLQEHLWNDYRFQRIDNYYRVKSQYYLNKNPITEEEDKSAEDRIVQRNHELTQLVDLIDKLPRCNYLLGEPPWRYKLQEEEQKRT